MKAFLSKLGQSFMLPIALLPAAGLLLGIGASFTGGDYGAPQGSFAYIILSILKDAGQIVFDNLPVLFAVALAVAFAKKDKGAAALSAVIGYLVMNAVIAGGIAYFGLTAVVDGGAVYQTFQGVQIDNLLTNVLGVENTMSMGVFGGIISGSITVWLHNRYIDANLPDFLGFFSGPRLIPILASFAAIFYGLVLVFFWPYIAVVLASIGDGFRTLSENNLGWVASGLHGYIERALIPIGLHHVYYLPLWQTSVGGSQMIDGVQVYGTQNIFMNLISNGTPADWEAASSTNFMAGKFPFMMFGLPAAAAAIWSVADKDNKKEAAGLMISVGLTAFLTGITEPIEFSFLFLAPGLYYGFHAVMAGVSFALMDLLQVKVGQTFSGGFIDFILYGVLPGVTGVNNHWYYIIVVGIFFAFIYFFVFRWYILKNDLKTPGRGAALKMVSKKEYQDSKGSASESGNTKSIANSADAALAAEVVEALGGAENLDAVDACITRLRVSVKDESKVADQDKFTRDLEAMGLSKNGKAIQVIYGQRAAKLKDIINEDIIGSNSDDE